MTQALILGEPERPALMLAQATEQAELLARVIEKQGLFVDIKGSRHVRLEGWTFLGSMRGVFPVVVWTHPIEGGWEARVEARTANGIIVGAAEAQCTRTETNWADRDDYALRSMAQTRAASKALRLPLGYIMVLAGFEATPAEEMPSESMPKPNQHWCKEHQTVWFKRGKMKGYAHLIADTGEWCNKPETSPLVQAALAAGATLDQPKDTEWKPKCPKHPKITLTFYPQDTSGQPVWAHKLDDGAWCKWAESTLRQRIEQALVDNRGQELDPADLDLGGEE